MLRYRRIKCEVQGLNEAAAAGWRLEWTDGREALVSKAYEKRSDVFLAVLAETCGDRPEFASKEQMLALNAALVEVRPFIGTLGISSLNCIESFCALLDERGIKPTAPQPSGERRSA